ncbi:secreted protein [gut metagenome]|uniref:Secreted protein n=1 Tax=gut metagenome TaxID=749906 RepID=J9G7P9_9ZZZZ
MRPIIRLASAPIANTSLVSFSTATTEGSRIIMPLSLQ